MPNPEPAHYHDLAAVERAAWALLARGVTDRQRLAHTPTLATLSEDGRPTARTVVLRAWLPEARELLFHTDQRSRKRAEIRAEPEGTVHVYEPEEKIQLRLACRLRVHENDGVAQARWSNTRAGSRTCYQVTAAPGSVVADPTHATEDPQATADGWLHFAVVRARIQSLEWLYLSARGHRRARIAWNDTTAERTWLVP